MEAGGSNNLSNSSLRTSSVIGPNGKFLVEMWPNGDFVGPNLGKFKTAVGDQVRLHIPINIPYFRLVQDCFKDAIWTALTEQYEFNVEAHFARPFVEGLYAQKLRTQRYKYRTEFLAKATNIEEARANIPPSLSPALWNEFVDREFQDQVKERNAKFKNNRSVNTMGGTLGRRSFSQKHYEMEKKDPTKKYCRVDGWLEARKRKDGTILPSAQPAYDKVLEAHNKILESGGTSEDINSDALSQVFGKEKKNRVRGVSSSITKKQLESACAATASVSLNPSPGTFAKVEKVEAAVARVEADISEMRSYMKTMFEMMQGEGRVHTPRTTPRIEGGSTSGKRIFPMDSPPEKLNAFGSHEQDRVILLDKDEREVAKGYIDSLGTICHGRKVVRGEKRVFIEEVLEPDCVVYDGPQDGNNTLNSWLDGGYIIWLEGRMKPDS